jgi:hypothetical protein
MIVSGHRRRKAIELLAADDPERWCEVPCIVELDKVSNPACPSISLKFKQLLPPPFVPAGKSKFCSLSVSKECNLDSFYIH